MAADDRSDASDRHRSDLLRLRLGLPRQSTRTHWQEHLEREHAVRVAGDGDNGDDASPQALGGPVCTIVADHDGWSSLSGFADAARGEVDPNDISAVHQGAVSEPRPSSTASSQVSASNASHSLHADA